MKNNKPKTVSHLLNLPQGEVRTLLDRLEKIKAIDSKFSALVPKSMACHCRVVNLRKGTLVIAVDAAVWLNKLRFQIPELLSQLRQQGFISLANIEIIVQPLNQ